MSSDEDAKCIAKKGRWKLYPRQEYHDDHDVVMAIWGRHCMPDAALSTHTLPNQRGNR